LSRELASAGSKKFGQEQAVAKNWKWTDEQLEKLKEKENLEKINIMTRIQEFNNQELFQEISNRVKKHEITEDYIKEAIAKGKKEHQEELKERIFKALEEEEKERKKLLAESYQRWANDQEEQNEINEWKDTENDGWND
jgi:hypothetical protein